MLSSAVRAADTSGTISGTVSNAATGNLLEGAKISLPQLNLNTFTDNTGRYVMTGVPAGTHELVATYLGLDPVRGQVVLATGLRVERDFDLTTAIYQLEAFKVTGEREGGAAAITAQRNADNVKNVVALDSFGNLPNMSAGEVVMRLPGVAGSPSDEGLNINFNIRGIDPDLNTITVDGGLLTSQGTTRTFELQGITGAMFESLELIKGHTPDKGADSLGGTLNLKTRSPLSLREKRRTTYSFTTRVAPSFTEQIPLREQHRAHPLVTLAHQEVFDVFGGQRNLGVAVNLFYSENAVGGYRTVYDFQNTVSEPAFVWDYNTWDNSNNRKQMSLNLKADFRLSPSTKLTLALTGNDNFERHRRQINTRAFTGNQNTVPNATTSGVIPGYTDLITQVRPVAASTIDMSMTGPSNYNVRMRRFDVGAEHEFHRLQIDYTAGIAQTNTNSGQGTAGTLTMRINNVGWILDRTQDNLHPKFTQAGGNDFTDPAKWRPTVNGLSNTNNKFGQQLNQVRANVRYELPVPVQTFVKAGVSWRKQIWDAWGKDNHRYSYIGAGPLPSDPSLITYNRVKTGRAIPQWQSHMFMDERRPRDPALWREDRYYHEQQKFTATRGATEEIPAGYIMAQGRLGREGWLGRTGYLTGVRTEQTKTEGWGWVRVAGSQGSNAAQQLADPVGSAQRDYASTYREVEGKYTKSFPSAHVFHDITPNLKARLSYSTSFGRPGVTELRPSETINETNGTVTISNPGLRPQTAQNWDATLEYYFEPVGQLSVGWFHKTIKDYIIRNQEIGIVGDGPDNGFNGDYRGLRLLTSSNAGTAIVQGWEFSYQQQYTFLPGLLKGLGGSFNYTRIDTHGMYGGTRYLTRRELAGFIPHVANASLSWRYRKFSTRVLYNFTGEHIDTFDANNPARSRYRFSYKTVNVGVAYQWRPSLGLSLDVVNLFNEPQAFYRGFKHRVQNTTINFVTVTAGVNGRF
ncbi:MAG: TonB-dependent receptor [Opitutaceae bacterium]